MVQPHPSPRPTTAELEILRILWERGPSTVREVHVTLSGQRSIGYTGVLKFLQIMVTKGLVVRNEDQPAHVYRAAQQPEITKRQVVGDLIHKMFNGSAEQLILHALQGKKASPEDLAEIRRMLDAYEARVGQEPGEGGAAEVREPGDDR